MRAGVRVKVENLSRSYERPWSGYVWLASVKADKLVLCLGLRVGFRLGLGIWYLCLDDTVT